MSLKQISIFLENSSYRLPEVTKALGDAGINLKALSLAGTSGFGIVRLLVTIPDTPGSLSELLVPLRDQRIDVEYMYAFTGFSSREAVMVFGFKDPAKATEVLKANGVALLGASEFGALENEGE